MTRNGLSAHLLAAILLAAGVVGAGDEDRRRPNVVIFFTDDQGTLDAHCYGSRDLYTPHMDALAARGVRFTRAYAHTVCCPARALLLTGRHPQRAGVNNWCQGQPAVDTGTNMDLDEVTLAEALRKEGYRTSLVGKWHLGARFTHDPLAQGFDEFFGHRGGFIDNYTHRFLHWRGRHRPFHDLYRGRKEVFRDGEYFPDLVVGEANRFLEASRDRPFFLLVAFNIPHYPEQSDAKFEKRYEKLPMPRRSYARMISTTDDRMGRILARLEELGLRENTLIVFLSDNGHSNEDYRSEDGTNYGANGGGGNTGKWRGAKGTFFEGGIRVPAIISLPGRIPAGEVRDQAITAADFYPTILELCGISLPDRKLDGRSLVPLLRSAGAPSPHAALFWQWQENWAVSAGDWKLIRTRRRGGKESFFLGNLTGEAPESENLAARHPGIVERLKRLQREWSRDVFGDS